MIDTNTLIRTSDQSDAAIESDLSNAQRGHPRLLCRLLASVESPHRLASRSVFLFVSTSLRPHTKSPECVTLFPSVLAFFFCPKITYPSIDSLVTPKTSQTPTQVLRAVSLDPSYYHCIGPDTVMQKNKSRILTTRILLSTARSARGLKGLAKRKRHSAVSTSYKLEKQHYL